MTRRTIALIDGNSLLYRAFFALPTSITTSEGRPTNAVYGFTSMLLRLMREEKPDAIAVAFDLPGKTFRHDAYEAYKAHRPATPDELGEQIPVAIRLLGAMAIPVLQLEGYEADDILGTLAKRAAAAGDEVVVVTGDRDAFQLIAPHVRVWTTRKGISDIVIYDRKGVEERYGIPPESVPDFIGLKGDTSDNIPGVPGVGEKTAADLLQRFGTVEGLYEHLDEIKSEKLRERLAGARDDAFLSKQLATIDTDAPVDIDFDACTVGGWDQDAVEAVFRDLQFKTLLERFLADQAGLRGTSAPARGEGGGKAASAAPACEVVPAEASKGVEAPERPEQPSPPPTTLGAEELRSLIGRSRAIAVSWASGAAGSGTLALEIGQAATLDLEAAEPSPESGARALALATEDVTAIAQDDAAQDAARHATAGRLAAGDMTLLGHQMKEEWRDELAGAKSGPTSKPPVFDVAIAAYLIESGRSAYPLGDLAWGFLGSKPPGAEAGPAERAAWRARVIWQLAEPLRSRLEQDGLAGCMDQVETPLVPVLARMEVAGVGLDCSRLESFSVELAAEIAALEARIYEAAGEPFNLNSPKQLGEVLFERLGLAKGRKTKTGYSTDAATLKGLACDYPIVSDILRYRELTKLKSTYVDALPKIAEGRDGGGVGRLHTDFAQTVAATGRLSSINPNLQNIPVRTDLGKRIRQAFVPARPGDLLMVADYSQIELRVLAHLSGDEALAEAFEEGLDIHTATACEVFGIEPGEVTSEHRRKAKAVNFGLVYGQSAHGLAESLVISREEAESYISLYFSRYPWVQGYIQQVIGQAFREGYVTTIVGRRRPIPELKSSNFQTRSLGERLAVNSPIQGSAADIIKLAMIAIDARLAREKLPVRMVLQVHDELVFEVDPGAKQAAASLVAEEMEGAYALSVPLKVDIGFGQDWGDAK
jgi:DNA polymerase-1